MQWIAMTAIYLAQKVLAAFLTDWCLRQWPRTAAWASRYRLCWLVPFILLSLLPVAGAFLPEGRLKYRLQAAGNVFLGYYVYFAGTMAVLLLLGVTAEGDFVLSDSVGAFRIRLVSPETVAEQIFSCEKEPEKSYFAGRKTAGGYIAVGEE